MRKPASFLHHFAPLARLVAAVSLLCIATAALAQSPGTPAPPSATDPGNPMTVDESANRNMGKMLNVPPTGDVDYDFVAMMREHHQGAIEMSQSYLKTGKDPQIRKMAEKIIADQQREISQFEAWQRKRSGAPVK